jgi:hypothetical protein
VQRGVHSRAAKVGFEFGQPQSEPLTKLAEYRDMPAERKAAEGEAFLRELLPAAWVKRNTDKRLAIGRSRLLEEYHRGAGLRGLDVEE